MSERWPQTFWLLTMWATDPELAFRASMATVGHGPPVTTEDWAAATPENTDRLWSALFAKWHA